MIRKILAVGALAAATACGQLAKDPASGTNFQAPAGWDATPSILGARLFISPRMDQFIVLETLPADATVDQVMEGVSVRDARDLSGRAVKLCGAEPARETTALVHFRSASDNMRMVMLTTTRADEQVVAAYLYRPDVHPDSTAERAIRRLCPSK